MIVFGPFRAIPRNIDFKVFNLSSLTQIVDKLPGLIPPSNIAMDNIEIDGERSFDMWYYDYVLNDPVACSSLMSILKALAEGNNIYICIYDYESDPYISMINEAFMKILQSRYELKYAIINDPSDIEYVDRDGCDFAGVNGIKNFDDDMKRYMELSIAEGILHGRGMMYDTKQFME
jgi:hypothetical protein